MIVSLAANKQVRALRLLSRKSDSDQDELTPAHRLKRQVVSVHCGNLVEDLFAPSNRV
jgi:hypothetical protein